LAHRSRFVGALCAGKNRIDCGKNASAVFLECIEGAGCRETFQHPLVDCARIDPRREVSEIGELPIVPRGDDCLNCLFADAFKCREGIDDRIAVDLKVDRRTVD
jgi:hypothetical protein